MDEEDNVVLQQRGEQDSHGKWDISVSGHVGVGEDDKVAAIRETAEELGAIVAPRELKRVHGSYQFCKEGTPDVKKEDEGHRGPFTYVYRTNKFNHERVSVFRVLATADHKREIASGEPRDALNAEWRSWTDVLAETESHPERFASGLKQLLHPDILEMLRASP